MKVKMLVAAITGLLAVSLAYADVDPSAGAVSGTGAINSGQDNSINGSDAMTNTLPQGTGTLTETPSHNGSDTGSLDQGTSDTATGDDDY